MSHYFYPKSNIFYSLIPKTGCTTVKNFLYAVESHYVTGESQLPSVLDAKLGVHREPSTHYLTRRSRPPRGSLSLVVLRDPYSRVSSAWLNKFLYAQEDYSLYHRFRQEDFVLGNDFGFEQIQPAFESFLLKLRGDYSFLNSDRHWKPQSSFIRNINDYTLVLETSNLHELPKALEDNGIQQHITSSYELPHFNKTMNGLSFGLWTDKTIQLIQDIYKNDLALLESQGIRVDLPMSSQVSLGREAAVQFDSELESIRASRYVSSNTYITRLLSSKSWRYTAWVRKLAVKFGVYY